MKTKAPVNRRNNVGQQTPTLLGVVASVALIGIVPCVHGYDAPRRFLIKDRCKKASFVFSV